MLARARRSRLLAAFALLLVGTAASAASAATPAPAVQQQQQRSTIAHPIIEPPPVRPPGMTYGAPGALTMQKAYAGFKLAPKLPSQRDQRTATVVTFLLTDDTAHQSKQGAGMLRMMDRQTPAGIHSVVFHDGPEVGDSRLYVMKPGNPGLAAIAKGGGAPALDGPMRAHQSLLAPGVTEVQSNNPKVFSQLVNFAFSKYSGQYKYLQIYTHGGGVRGIGTDSRQTDTTGTPLAAEQHLMSAVDFASSLRSGLKGRVLDGIYFRSCLMGNLEALYELRGTTKYAIASELPSSSVDNSNLTMTKLFQTLAAAGTEPREVARQMSIAAYAKSGKLADGSPGGYDTMMAADIGKVGELKSAINSLVLQMRGAMPRERANIVAAYDETGFVHGQMGDLYNFTHQLQMRVKDPGVLAAVDRVRAAQRGFMIHEKDVIGADNEGLSIFMPQRQGLEHSMETSGYGQTRFAQESAWPEFLKSIAEPPAASP